MRCNFRCAASCGIYPDADGYRRGLRLQSATLVIRIALDEIHSISIQGGCQNSESLTDCGGDSGGGQQGEVLLMYRDMKLAVIVSISLIGTFTSQRLSAVCCRCCWQKVNLDPAIMARSDYYHAGGYMFDSDLLYCGFATRLLHYKSAGGGNRG